MNPSPHERAGVLGIGQRVRHVDGREGVITRSDAMSSTVSVRFPGHHRVSVILRSCVTPLPEEQGR